MEHYERERTRDEVFSKAVKAGKRTYFFDVKSTKKNELYLTITESKKHFEEDGNATFEKHKLFLYREDFTKFKECLEEVIDYIYQNSDESDFNRNTTNRGRHFSNLDFDDLDR